MMEEVYTTLEASKILKVDRGTLSRWLHRGVIPGVKLGRTWRIRGRDIENLLTPDFTPLDRVTLDNEDIEAIEEAKRDVREGRTKPLKQVMRETECK